MLNGSDDGSGDIRGVYLELCHGSESLGRLELELFVKDCPKTVANFCTYIENGTYEGCLFHRLIPGFMIQGGDFLHQDGTGCTSIYGGKPFDDESLWVHSHNRRGKLCMANSGPNTNGCQFYITFKPIPHLNGKHTVFGQTSTLTTTTTTNNNNNNNERILHYLENNVPTNPSNNKPKQKVFIQKCGIIHSSSSSSSIEKDISTLEHKSPQTTTNNNNNNDNSQDDNEIDIEEDDDEIEIEEEEEEEEEIVPVTNTLSKKAALQKRLQLLRRKMNQSRQLHQKEVRKEAEEIIHGGKKKKQQKNDIKDSSFLHQQAQESLAIQRNKEIKKEQTEYSVRDYHNPEGQFRNYERNVASLPINATTVVDERQGAHRLATELKRRMIKQQNKQTKKRERDFLHNHLADVSHVNQRNKRFNEKINRTYDKHTAEIKQNLERGTAL